jgi:putative ABC transport system permease protein
MGQWESPATFRLHPFHGGKSWPSWKRRLRSRMVCCGRDSFEILKASLRPLQGLTCPWFVAGGWALDLFLGRVTRPHHDVDIALFREDQRQLRSHFIAGRDFDIRDENDKQNVVIIDDATAKHFFPGQSPLGRQIDDLGPRYGQATRQYYTIIGIAQNIRHDSPDVQQANFQAYFPVPASLRNAVLLIRSEGAPMTLTPAVRKILTSIDSSVPLAKVSTLNERIAGKFATRRLATFLVGSFSGVSLFLAAVGLYGVLGYYVDQRRREIGVRIALGAQSREIFKLVISQGFKIVMFGMLVGLLGALVVTRAIESMLYSVTWNDPSTLGIAMFILALAAFLACLLPAMRAARIDPNTVLRG